MKKLVRTDFVIPYPQEALGGEEGLTAHDIAKSLGVELKSVLKKLRRDKWHNNPEWLTVSIWNPQCLQWVNVQIVRLVD